eukprot:CAMPEP_0172315650 /NCGR_PEP_ID=MMETSP1058-20130122/25873_1 /TAXON_ID=83371 /ORGANISM="Detonula confervacea, Strain CCMP 353" /LENGTH=292 /DNA_ID=CAMNT_0013029775 /DNA_START=100 /DNA_END=975 /DNA_ORIENTATION=+
MNPSDEPIKETIEEVQWTDDSIRWEGGLHVKKAADESDKESDDDEDYVVDPFKDPDPFELFSFQFERPGDKSSCDGEKDKLIDIQIRGYKTDADEVWQSTGLTLWRASDYLCQYQMENLNLFQNKRVLELGAGLGLNGILAWRSTATASSTSSSEVCITDGDIDALVHLRENVERNRSTVSNGGDVGKVSCHQLIWGKQSSEHFLSHVANDKKYDVILASDIIYSPVIVEPLWETVETLLKKPNGCEEEGGVFVMAYAKRKVPVSIELVCETAVEHGFVYELVKGDDEDGIW